MSVGYGIGTYLDISTIHISLKTLDHDSLPFHIASYPEGVFMWIPDDLEDCQETIPDDLKVVFQFATDRACNIVRFDADGFQFPELPEFDW
mgnify:FL=1